jgi:hypothetical protein
MGKRLPRTELLAEIARERAALDAVLAQVSDRDKRSMAITPGGWTVKDVIAHMAAWQAMMLAWYTAGLGRQQVAVPAPGYSWRETPRLNQAIYRKHRRQSLRAVTDDLDRNHERIIGLVEELSDRELLTVGRYAWMGPSWTLSDYVRANTASHYRWARRHIAGWVRAQRVRGGPPN